MMHVKLFKLEKTLPFKGADLIARKAWQFIARLPPEVILVGGAWPVINDRASCTMKSAPLKEAFFTG
jgi:hypothetical protein